MQDVLIRDSAFSEEQAKAQNPAKICPENIWNAQRVLAVRYHGFDGALHEGQIVVHEEVMKDVADLFAFLLELKFPLRSVIPVSDPRFHWEDELSMAADNSSGFNFRTIMNTDRISWHGYGRAIDLNPALNPYVTSRGIFPSGATYDPSRPGTLAADSAVVKFMEEKGWTWGGRWKDLKDYQHFEKPFPAEAI